MKPKTPIVFDTDCISSFLWIRRLDILQTLYAGSMLIPDIVEKELAFMKKSRYPYVYLDLIQEVGHGTFQIYVMAALSEMATRYMKYINGKGTKQIGKGEAAAIVIAEGLAGTLASNNLKDVYALSKSIPIPLMTSDDILYQYYREGHMNISDGDQIRMAMRAKRRQLPSYDFQKVIRLHENA